MSLAAFASAYAERGWPVFPLWGLRPRPGGWVCRCGRGPECESPGKHPHALAAHGFHDATVARAVVARWWETDGAAAIGVRCGDVFDVLDVDHTDFATGVADLPDCVTDGGPVVRTGAGKWHLYFAASGLGRKIRFSTHCDWLGTGGYVIAPPSPHVAGEPYRWFAPFELPLMPPPPALRDVLDPPVRWSTPVRPTPRGGRRWSAAGLVARVAIAPEGERNSVLNWAAWKVGCAVERWEASEDEALAVLDDLAVAAARAGLGAGEIEHTLRSGYDAGLTGRGQP